MKLFSLLRATLSQDMNLFKYEFKNDSKVSKKVFPVLLFLMVSASLGVLIYRVAKPLASLNLTFIILSICIIGVTILSFFEGIVKSQGIIFESKDNDLLLSLPIKKSYIIFVRITKLLIFEYLYNLLFLLPAFIIYIYFEHPGFNFYVISFLMTLLIPIIPTILACFIGYIVKMFSSKSNSKKLVQLLLTSVVFIGIFFINMYSRKALQTFISNAKSINEIITKIYYPTGAYLNLINEFNFLTLIKLLAINILPFILFILIASKFYFRIISDSINTSNKQSKKYNSNMIKKRSVTMALVKKELTKYFSSVTYMLNTTFGLILMVVLSVLFIVKGDAAINKLLGVNLNATAFVIFYFLILFSLAMTSITSSSISLEGKSINILKALPIKYQTILNSKIITCFIIEMPFVLISIIAYILKFDISILSLGQLLISGAILIFISAVIGLLINTRYPKFNWNNDTEVVKQSMSSTVSVFIGMGIFIFNLITYIVAIRKLHFSPTLTINLQILVLLIISMILYHVLMTWGPKEYKKFSI